MNDDIPHHTISPLMTKILRAGFTFLTIIGAGYAVLHLYYSQSGTEHPSLHFLVLAGALLIALAFEFVNGFHDTANAVATVIYSRSLSPTVAVLWSGIWNFIGVLCSSGAVAFTVVSLLPIELILDVGTPTGFTMIYAMLIAAILWNLLTWLFGIPNSSSHTLIGSILGIGLMNQFFFGPAHSSSVNWKEAFIVLQGLFFSPLIGFIIAMMAMFFLRRLIKKTSFGRMPDGESPPPIVARILLILTCMGISFSHGSNDGQKGMGLIMLVMIGAVPTLYAINTSLPTEKVHLFQYQAKEARTALNGYLKDHDPTTDPRTVVTRTIQREKFSTGFPAALDKLIGELQEEIGDGSSLQSLNKDSATRLRSDLYLVEHASQLIIRNKILPHNQEQTMKNFHSSMIEFTEFIPFWVKLSVAFALGLGTMVGWKKIAITIGRKLGRQKLNYAQGTVAQTVGMSVIESATYLSLPVSTTHALTSAVSGAIVGSGYKLQPKTLLNIVLAWVLTLPISIILSGFLYWVLHSI